MPENTSQEKPDIMAVETFKENVALESESISVAKPKVHFSLLSAIGVQYAPVGAPLAIGAYLSLAIGLGGSPAYFWGFIVMGVFQLPVCLAISELASALPHSSGT